MAELTPALAEMRDSLIAELDGAIKFQPILEQLSLEAIGAVPLEAMRNLSKEAAATVLAAAIDDAVLGKRAEILAMAQAEDAKYVEQLRAEIVNDPDKRGYAGMTPEQIVDEMAREIIVKEPVPGRTRLRDIVQGVLKTLIERPENIMIGPDGTVLSDHPGLQALIDKAIEDSKLTAEQLAESTETTIVSVRNAPWSRVARRVKYVRNIVRIEEVRRALA